VQRVSTRKDQKGVVCPGDGDKRWIRDGSKATRMRDGCAMGVEMGVRRDPSPGT
jgi:hypothetical protein